MAVIEGQDPFVIELESGEVLLVVEEESALVEATTTETVETEVRSLDIVEEESGGFIIEEDGEPVALVQEPEQFIVEGECPQGPPGPRGPAGPPGVSGITLNTIDIAPGETEVVDEVNTDDIVGVEWSLIGEATDIGDRRGVKVYATWDSAGNTWRSVYSRSGGGFAAYGISVTIGINLDLSITNNHTDTLRMFGTRLDIAST